jgi:hypothetical protein
MHSTNTFELYGKYKDLYLFNTGKGSVLFKALSYDKCETAKRICKSYPALAPIVEDNIWEECVIEHTLPGTLSTLNAGLVSTIVRLILGFSNPTSQQDIEYDIREVREKSNNIREDIIIKICQAFPSYSPDQVEAMEWRTQLKRLVQAEKILGTTFSFIDKAKIKTNVPKGNGPAMKEVNGQQFIDFEKENQVLNGA